MKMMMTMRRQRSTSFPRSNAQLNSRYAYNVHVCLSVSPNSLPPPSPSLPPSLQRLRHIHYYLWILAFGRDSIEEGSGPERETTDPQARQDTGAATTKRREKEEVAQQKLDLILPETNYPWARAVNRLPRSSKGEGWLQFSEVHHYMPLSLWLIIINMYRGKAVSGCGHVTVT